MLLIAATPIDGALDHPINPVPDVLVGCGATSYATLPSVAQHYLYHAGQIALLRKFQV